ncbi:MAG: phosphatase PAP2 family protein [Proteobacteria bacterium]|nr:phosphatase PAP2 family protein [Pseudomonadota bacterium]
MRKFILKALIKQETKWAVFMLCLLLFGMFYALTGHLSGELGITIEMTSLERAIPLMPWTIWIYSGLYPVYLLWCFYHFQDMGELNKTLYGFFILTLISGCCFIFYPLISPRVLYPVLDTSSLNGRFLLFIRSTDTVGNCFPSLHVGFCTLFALTFYRTNIYKFIIAMIVATLISVSTLTIKQHYLVDVIGGAMLASLIYFVMDRWTRVVVPPSQK